MPKRDHLWIPLELRLTFQFRLGWEGDELWKQIGKVRELKASRKIWHDDEGYTRTRIVAVRAKATRREIKRALQHSFTFGCQCVHDCCGHAFCGYVDVKHLKGREYLVTQHVYHNC